MIVKNEMRNYNLDVEIDETNLEGEWILQPSLYLHYSEWLAEAIKIRDDIKLKLEWISADLDLKIRKDWQNYGFDSKPTEGGIKNTITMDEQYQEYSLKLNRHNKSVNALTGARSAFEHRKAALANLVSLKIGGFYSEPKNLIKEMKDKKIKQAHNEHKDKLNANLKRRKLIKKE